MKSMKRSNATMKPSNATLQTQRFMPRGALNDYPCGVDEALTMWQVRGPPLPVPAGWARAPEPPVLVLGSVLWCRGVLCSVFLRP